MSVIEFSHHFCESRLTQNQGPELWNAYTSLFISFVPLIYEIPRNKILYNISTILMLNGLSSFYYHYYLDWYGKQGDEISMIMANYYGLYGLLRLYYKYNIPSRGLSLYYNNMNTVFMILFIVLNTDPRNDYLFPHIFTLYLLPTITLIYKVGNKYNIPYKNNLALSSCGAFFWILSELMCTEFTKYGHVLWHLLFPLGFYRLILDFDKISNL